MAFPSHDVVRRIKAYPAKAREVDLDPGMGRILAGAVLILAAMVEVTRDIARRDAPTPHNGDHDMGEVLTDASAFDERLRDRGMHLRDAHFVIEGAVNNGVELFQG